MLAFTSAMWYEEVYVTKEPVDAASNRALQGGSWSLSTQHVRAAYRDGFHLGLRNLDISLRGASAS